MRRRNSLNARAANAQTAHLFGARAAERGAGEAEAVSEANTGRECCPADLSAATH